MHEREASASARRQGLAAAASLSSEIAAVRGLVAVFWESSGLVVNLAGTPPVFGCSGPMQ